MEEIEGQTGNLHAMIREILSLVQAEMSKAISELTSLISSSDATCSSSGLKRLSSGHGSQKCSKKIRYFTDDNSDSRDSSNTVDLTGVSHERTFEPITMDNAAANITPTANSVTGNSANTTTSITGDSNNACMAVIKQLQAQVSLLTQKVTESQTRNQDYQLDRGPVKGSCENPIVIDRTTSTSRKFERDTQWEKLPWARVAYHEERGHWCFLGYTGSDMFIFDPELPPTSYRQSLILAKRIGLPIPDDSLCMGNFMVPPGNYHPRSEGHSGTSAGTVRQNTAPTDGNNSGPNQADNKKQRGGGRGGYYKRPPRGGRGRGGHGDH